jgi:transcriptional regulator with XRE-family HTH domain
MASAPSSLALAMMAAPLRELVRARIRALRRERGLSQEALCERAGISVDAVTRIERGSRVPTLDTLERLAGALGVSVVELVAPPVNVRPSKVPAPVRRIVALLEREPPEVQDGMEEIARALLRTVKATRRR